MLQMQFRWRCRNKVSLNKTMSRDKQQFPCRGQYWSSKLYNVDLKAPLPFSRPCYCCVCVAGALWAERISALGAPGWAARQRGLDGSSSSSSSLAMVCCSSGCSSWDSGLVFWLNSCTSLHSTRSTHKVKMRVGLIWEMLWNPWFTQAPLLPVMAGTSS